MSDQTLTVVPETNPSAPQINWGWEEEGSSASKWTIDERLEHVCQLASSLNEAVALHQTRVEEQDAEILLLKKKLEASENLRTIDRSTLTEVITNNNLGVQEAGAKIQALQVRVKEQDDVIRDLRDGRG
jgi:uncharacterized coiled-coil protein SlyX